MLINPYALHVSGGGGATDPHFANVSLLLHFTGNLTDSSSNALTVVPTGTYNYDATGGPFGGECIDLASTLGGASAGGYLSRAVTGGDVTDLGSGDWTIEGFWKYDGTAAAVIFSYTYDDHIHLITNIGGAGHTDCKVEGVTINNGALSASAWHHLAIVMASDIPKLYIDGVSTGSTSTATRSTWSSETFYIGGTQYGVSWPGKVAEFRMTKGVARYLANFTPPSAPFPDY